MPRFTPLDLKCVPEYAVVGEGLCDVTESVDALLLKPAVGHPAKGCMPTFWGHLVAALFHQSKCERCSRTF